MFLGLLCSLQAYPLRPSALNWWPGTAPSGPCPFFKNIHPRGSGKGSQPGWEGTEARSAMACPAQPGYRQLPISCLQPQQGQEGLVLTLELSQGPIIPRPPRP